MVVEDASNDGKIMTRAELAGQVTRMISPEGSSSPVDGMMGNVLGK
jgi:hypothetical protein